MFVTQYEHKLIHAVGGYEKSVLTLNQKLYKEKNSNRSLKNYLRLSNLSYEEFLETKYNQLTSLYPVNKYELFLKNKELNGLATYHEKLKEKQELEKLNQRIIKPKSEKHKKILQLQRNLRKEAYQRLKEWKDKKKLDFNNDSSKLDTVNI